MMMEDYEEEADPAVDAEDRLFEGDTGALTEPQRWALTSLLASRYVSQEAAPELFESIVGNRREIERYLSDLYLKLVIVTTYGGVAYVRGVADDELYMNVRRKQVKRTGKKFVWADVLAISVCAHSAYSAWVRGMSGAEDSPWIVRFDEVERTMKTQLEQQEGRDDKRAYKMAKASVRKLMGNGYVVSWGRDAVRDGDDFQPDDELRVMPILLSVFSWKEIKHVLDQQGAGAEDEGQGDPDGGLGAYVPDRAGSEDEEDADGSL